LLETVENSPESREGVPLSPVSLSFLRDRIPVEFQEQFVEDTGVCLDCGGLVVAKEEELCCTRCGRVWSDGVQVEDDRIPMEEESVGRAHAEASYSPGSELAFGHGLGAGLDGRGLFRILAQGKNGNKDLPLRAMQVRLITSKLDHPVTHTVLSYGSALCKNYGLHTNKESSVIFANTLGKELRKIAGYYVVRGETGGELRRVTSAVFYLLYVTVHPNKAKKLLEDLHINKEIIEYTQMLLSTLKCPKPAKKLKVDA
jgi:hypothetical protein